MRIVVAIRPPCHAKHSNTQNLLVSGVKSVSRHEEALTSGGSFAQQVCLIAQQNFAIHVCISTCAFTTQLSSA